MKTISIIGNVGTPAQLRVSADGKQFATFSVAVSERDGSALWFGVIGKVSENLLPYIAKGRQVYVSGDLQAKDYNGKVDLTIYAERIELCGKSGEEQAKSDTPTPQDTAPDVY